MWDLKWFSHLLGYLSQQAQLAPKYQTEVIPEKTVASVRRALLLIGFLMESFDFQKHSKSVLDSRDTNGSPNAFVAKAREQGIVETIFQLILSFATISLPLPMNTAIRSTAVAAIGKFPCHTFDHSPQAPSSLQTLALS